MTLRLDLSDCQVDAIIAGSYSGAGLLVADLTTDAGSALIHGNRFRSRFPMGETALVAGVGEVSVTGNVVANEVAPQLTFEAASPATAVSFGGAAAAFTPGSTHPDTQLMVTVPAGSGTVDVTVTTPAGTSQAVTQDQFTYLAVTGVSPASGLANARVTVTGSGFTGPPQSISGPNLGSSLIVPNENQLEVTAPAGSGTVDVTVITPAGTSQAVAADQFAYLQVTGINPNSARAGTLTVTGNGFVAGATTVTFTSTSTGQVITAAGNVTGPGTLTVNDPISENESGNYNVTVTIPAGTSPPPPVVFNQLGPGG